METSMTVYEKLLRDDWVRIFEERFKSGEARFSEDGRIEARRRLTPDLPWIGNKEMLQLESLDKCPIYQWFFSEKLGIIHSHCHNCYKIVVEPRTVKELFLLYDLQTALKMPAKCGVELRAYIPRLYGGYFYFRSLGEGKMNYPFIRNQIDMLLSPDVAVSLKKGCTEFEMKHGPSDKWEIQENQYQTEKEFDEIYIEERSATEQPDYLKAHIQHKWLYYAAEHYDMTYKEFTGGQALIPECKSVTYHSSTEKEAVNE
jgi:hypothetical protein